MTYFAGLNIRPDIVEIQIQSANLILETLDGFLQLVIRSRGWGKGGNGKGLVALAGCIFFLTLGRGVDNHIRKYAFKDQFRG